MLKEYSAWYLTKTPIYLKFLLIIQKAHCQRRFPWFPLVTSSYCPSFLPRCAHRADEWKFFLVWQHWWVYMRKSLLSFFLISLIVPSMFCSLHLNGFAVAEIKRKYNCCSSGYSFQNLFQTISASVYSSHSVFLLCVFFKFKWCNHTVVLTRLWLKKSLFILSEKSDFHKLN